MPDLALQVAVRDGTAEDPGVGNPVLERVPTEILCEIFRLTLPWDRRIPRRSQINEVVYAPPWRLGVVCRRWRESALGDSSLWTRIVIEYPGTWGSSTAEVKRRHPFAALEAQLLRSGDALLDATLTCATSGRQGDELPSAVQLLGLLEILVRHSHRLERFHLGWKIANGYSGGSRLYPCETELPTILARMTGRLPQLRRLQLVSGETMPPQTGEIFRVAPRLREVFLTHTSSEQATPPSTDILAPWAQITHLRAHLEHGPHLEILRQTENLVECRLHTPYSVDPSPGTPTIVLPHLRRLSLSADPEVLTALVTPSLEYLFLDHPSVDSVLSFLQRSRCPLKGFTGQDCLLPGLLQLLPNMPALLHLHAVCGDMHGFTQLLRDLPNHCLQLVSLSLHIAEKLSEDDHQTLYNFILAGRRTLKFVTIGEATFPPVHADRFLSLRSEGIDVVFSYYLDSAFAHPLGIVTREMVPP
ncbi:hypothetical protein C8R46DRAFT_390974 [Mycena filopes]|nr:hypothetical protein C8R46DRAFT_390974 [Mycena filopes]